MSTQTVAEVLLAANDSVELINDINTNGSDSICDIRRNSRTNK